MGSFAARFKAPTAPKPAGGGVMQAEQQAVSAGKGSQIGFQRGMGKKYRSMAARRMMRSGMRAGR